MLDPCKKYWIFSLGTEAACLFLAAIGAFCGQAHRMVARTQLQDAQSCCWQQMAPA